MIHDPLIDPAAPPRGCLGALVGVAFTLVLVGVAWFAFVVVTR